MTTAERPTHPHGKALELNLDPVVFGSFAEIGAGQEVARWFFRVGASSGTVAKTVCAYDKAVSDDLYGAGERYVSRPRLDSMLRIEWESLLKQVRAERPDATLFAFANTASARNYAGTNTCHGWVGVRFQTTPSSPPSDLVLHANLGDGTNEAQQEALGILGVNLVHAAHYARQSPTQLLSALFDELDRRRIEIDVLEPSGEAFVGWDVRSLHAALVASGLAEAVMLPADGAPCAAAETLYKTPVVLAPGRFEHVEPLHGRALAAATRTMRDELDADDGGWRPCLGMFALPLPHGAELDTVVARIDALHSIGGDVMLFRREELYRMTEYVQRYTKAPIRFAVSIGVLVRVLEEARYEGLEGRILEAVARLFERNVRMDVYPSATDALDPGLRELVRGEPGAWVTAHELRPEPPLSHLFDYLLAAGFIVPRPPVDVPVP